MNDRYSKPVRAVVWAVLIFLSWVMVVGAVWLAWHWPWQMAALGLFLYALYVVHKRQRDVV